MYCAAPPTVEPAAKYHVRAERVAHGVIATSPRDENPCSTTTWAPSGCTTTAADGASDS